MANDHQKILIVQTKPPYGSSSNQEALDIVLAAGTFDQDVSLLITEDACYQLLPSQEPELIQQKNISKMLQALSIYGIDKIYIDKAQAESRGITEGSTSLHIQFIAQTEIEALYRNADTILRF